VPLREVLTDRNLLRLNFGIFTLHLTQMAMFVVLPQLLVSTGTLPVAEHWKLYLPAVLVAFAFMAFVRSANPEAVGTEKPMTDPAMMRRAATPSGL
jgi:hypothetical protein